ncbi:MAG TPA: DoxX family protein [Chitinophagaceae bacterium]|jgi:putative oxidoreductase|nr:DoxX family protein [Chitinophagaceae bacterium]
MKKLLSTGYSAGAFNLALLCLRLVFGINMLIIHGLDKLQKFETLKTDFYNFMGLGQQTSLVLAIFAEFFCSFFIILGLFTRFTVVPLIITMLIIIFGNDKGKALLESEVALMYLCSYVVLLLCGPGKISVDGMIAKG